MLICDVMCEAHSLGSASSKNDSIEPKDPELESARVGMEIPMSPTEFRGERNEWKYSKTQTLAQKRRASHEPFDEVALAGACTAGPPSEAH